MRLCLIAALLCGFFGSKAGIRAQGIVCGEERNDAQICANDGWLKQVAEEPQGPIGASLQDASSSHRLASSRPSRQLPTHGGRTGHHHGRLVADGLSNLYKYHLCWQRCSIVNFQILSSSPRLYYVIALRRLLC